jgi:hypothetical protein
MGHHHIKNDEMGLVLMKLLKPGFAVFGSDYLVAARFEATLDEFQQETIIVNDQYSFRHAVTFVY